VTLPQPSEDDYAWFDQLLPDAPGVTRQPMLGNVAGFIDGQMFLALLGDRLAVRLGPVGREELLAIDGTAPFEPMPGRPLREYVVLPEAWRNCPTEAEAWVRRSMEFASALPEKSEPARKRSRLRLSVRGANGRKVDMSALRRQV
jgi:hypothetical protein